MKKEYSVEYCRRNELNMQNLKRASKLVFIVTVLFMSFAALTGFFTWTTFLYTTLTIFVAAGVGLLIGSMKDTPLNNTLITITEQHIIRSGDGLLTVELNFNEIKKSIIRTNGIILLKKGWRSSFKFYIYKYALIYGFGIIFIPFNIRDYEKIVEILNSRITC